MTLTTPDPKQFQTLFPMWKPGFRKWRGMAETLDEITGSIDAKGLVAVWLSHAAHAGGNCLLDIVLDYGLEKKLIQAAYLRPYGDMWHWNPEDYASEAAKFGGTLPLVWEMWKP
jgi:hypothetical protein